MLENILKILNITDTTYDDLINLYIEKVTKRVLAYCKIKDFEKIDIIEQDGLNEFIEDKVISIMQGIIPSEDTTEDNVNQQLLKNQGAIKTITRGDTSITYNYDSISSGSSNGTSYDTEFTSTEKEYLNQFRRCKLF